MGYDFDLYDIEQELLKEEGHGEVGEDLNTAGIHLLKAKSQLMK